MRKIRFCSKCGIYTLKLECASCGSSTVINAPIKYSFDPEVSKYRRMSKKNIIDEKTKGIL
ncbi:ribosome biogenesis protein [Candidatus Parvarchaeota archaeon]|nr:ribosome biogenesis protein [Candidatus Parvarchaeota archaeon]